MSGRQPWWYSGDEATAGEPAQPVEPESRAAPEAASGSEGASDEGPAEPRLDMSALAQGAQRLIEWATERVVVPHAEHADPAAHPDCLMCRAALLMGPTGPGPSRAGESGHRTAAEPITWLTVVDERPVSRRHP